MVPTPAVSAKEMAREIEYDPHDRSREYIPLPGGWEIQTKGAGSSYRLLDKKTGERHAILSGKDWQGLQAFFTRFAHELFQACRDVPAPAALSATEGEAVAWRYELSHAVRHHDDGRMTGENWKWHLTDYRPNVPEWSIRNLTALGPLYASPRSAPAGVKAMRAALETAVRLNQNAKRGKADGRVFIDYRDWEAFMAEVRSSLQPDTQAHGGGVEAVLAKIERENAADLDAATHNGSYEGERLVKAKQRVVDLVRAALSASPVAPAPAAGVESLPYQVLFDAIAAATDIVAGGLAVSISVEKFRAALLAASDAKGER